MSRARHPRRPASPTRPQGPRTGHAHAKCYAREFADCSQKISREHYISENVLDRLSVSEIAGAAWHDNADELVPASPKSLASKMLCDRHNSTLSALDAAGGDFIDTLLRFDHALRDSAPPVAAEEVACNGADVERWMLKVIVGMAFGGAFRTARFRSGAPVVPILFGEREWPAGWGMYVSPQASPIWGHQGLEVLTHVHGDEFWGARFAVGGVLIGLAFGTPDAPAQRRPAGLEFDRPDRPNAQVITFTWPKRPASPYQRFTRVGEYDGPRPQDVHLTRASCARRADAAKVSKEPGDDGPGANELA